VAQIYQFQYSNAPRLILVRKLLVYSGRLAGLVGRSSGYVENLPTYVKRRVEGLKGVQAKYTELEAQMKREMLELEKKVRKDSSVCLCLRRLIF
jgi:hypothetical protein